MAQNDDGNRSYEARLRRRQRRPTLRRDVTAEDLAAVRRQMATTRESEMPAAPREEHTTMKIPSFRRLALADYVKERQLPADLERLLSVVMTGARDDQLRDELGTDPQGLWDLEHRFARKVGKSVYLAAVEVVNRATRMRREALDD